MAILVGTGLNRWQFCEGWTWGGCVSGGTDLEAVGWGGEGLLEAESTWKKPRSKS